VAKLRKDLFRAIAIQDVSFFDSTRTGELTNRLASDTVRAARLCDGTAVADHVSPPPRLCCRARRPWTCR
jgi:ABC-type multidrug transport system fused ATPase/permease subunit